MKPLVSIVIPTYNYGHLVSQAIDSALAQTYPFCEVIVVDDGSTDSTTEALQPYGDKIRTIRQENQGLSAARNTGIRHARGDYVALLDSDDAFHPEKVRRQMAIFESCSDLACVGTEIFSTEPVVWQDVPPNVPPANFFGLKELVLTTRFAPSSAIIRKSALEEVGLFRTDLTAVEDKDMWIRLAIQHKVAMLPEPLTWYRQTPGSMSKQAYRMHSNDYKVLASAFAIPALRGRIDLRLKAYSLSNLRTSFLFFQAGCPWHALRYITQSMLKWPLPFFKPNVHKKLVRVKLFAASLLRGLKSLLRPTPSR